jgi:hypothetical protein
MEGIYRQCPGGLRYARLTGNVYVFVSDGISAIMQEFAIGMNDSKRWLFPDADPTDVEIFPQASSSRKPFNHGCPLPIHVKITTSR